MITTTVLYRITHIRDYLLKKVQVITECTGLLYILRAVFNK